MKENRRKLKVQHTSGAMPFAQTKKAMTGELHRPPTLLELWDRTRTKKGSTEFVSKPAAEIRERYRQLRAKRVAEIRAAQEVEGQDTTMDDNDDTFLLAESEDIAMWIEAQGPISKYRVLGYPNTPLYMLQPGSYYSTRIRSRLSSGGTSEGSSATGAYLPDELFTRAMDMLADRFATNDRFRQCRLPNHERLHTLAQEVAAAAATPDSQVMSSECFNLFRREIVDMLVTVLENVFRLIVNQREGHRTEEHPLESRLEDDHRTPEDAPIDRDATLEDMSGSSTSTGRRRRLYRQHPSPNSPNED